MGNKAKSVPCHCGINPIYWFYIQSLLHHLHIIQLMIIK